MKAKRNTSGLKENAQAKRREAFDKVEKGIQMLIKGKRPINFNQVAEASGVSKAWLYKEPDIKARIDHLRAQSKQGKKLPRKISATEASTKALNATLQARVRKVETENRDLRRQNEVAYGQVIRVRELERQLERITAENERLRAQSLSPVSLDIGFDAELKAVGVRLNSTLQRLISEIPEGIVQTALEALREAQGIGEVKNPGGFLNAAIRDAWKPNEQLQKNDELALFNEWWPKARQAGLVIASEQRQNRLYVCTINKEWLPLEEAIETTNIR